MAARRPGERGGRGRGGGEGGGEGIMFHGSSIWTITLIPLFGNAHPLSNAARLSVTHFCTMWTSDLIVDLLYRDNAAIWRKRISMLGRLAGDGLSMHPRSYIRLNQCGSGQPTGPTMTTLIPLSHPEGTAATTCACVRCGTL